MKLFAQVARDVVADQGRADFFGIERRHLLVDRADLCALGVVQHRAVDRAGDVIVGEFAFRTDIDDGVVAVQLRGADGGDGALGCVDASHATTPLVRGALLRLN